MQILAQAKGKDIANDALPRFLERYTGVSRVATLVKETHSGKMVAEWDKLVAESSKKPELVDMGPAVSAFMAVKDDEELVCASCLIYCRT